MLLIGGGMVRRKRLWIRRRTERFVQKKLVEFKVDIIYRYREGWGDKTCIMA